jgi:hypothetical protein
VAVVEVLRVALLRFLVPAVLVEVAVEVLELALVSRVAVRAELALAAEVATPVVATVALDLL